MSQSAFGGLVPALLLGPNNPVVQPLLTQLNKRYKTVIRPNQVYRPPSPNWKIAPIVTVGNVSFTTKPDVRKRIKIKLC